VRLQSITLRNFRGVSERTIKFPEEGVTVLVGPNEVGKSSISDALDVLLEYPHDSRHRDVLGAYPIGSSASPFVEVTLVSGEYRLTVAKQWRSGAMTELTIHEPKFEKLTGRDAHDRLRAVLDETMDTGLFKALRYFQGDLIKQGDLAGSTSLMAALDAQSGGTGADSGAETDLWKAVESEYLRYFTQTGRDTGARMEMANSLRAAQSELTAAESELRSLEEDGEKLRELNEKIASKNAQLEENAKDLEVMETRWGEVEAIAAKVAGAESDVRLVAVENERAQELLDTRRTLVDGVEEAMKEETKQRLKSDALAPQVERADEEWSIASSELKDADAAVTDAKASLEEAQDHADYRRARVAAHLLDGRNEQVDAADSIEREATQIIDATSVSKRTRTTLDKALNRRLTAAASLDATSSQMRVRALARTEITLNGTNRKFERDDAQEVRIDGTANLTVPGVVEVTISSGAAAPGVAEEHAAAEKEVASLVERYGLRPEDPREHIDELLAGLERAEQDRRHAAEMRSAALIDLTPLELDAKLANALAAVERLEAKGLADSGGLNTEESDARVKVARRLLEATEHVQMSAISTIREIEASQARLRQDGHSTEQLLEQAEQTSARREQILSEARATVADDVLQSAKATADERLRVKSGVLATLQRELSATDRESLEATLRNERALHKRLSGEVRTDSDRVIDLRATLRTKGSADLQTAIDEQSVRVVRLEVEYESVERRARAVEYLRERLGRHRDEARTTYVAPYQHQIQRLSRIVFGPDTEIEIDPADFKIVNRRVGDEVVPFAQLSTGAREQLSVIARLACAIIVSPSALGGGAPVILDDALGYSDPERLRRLGPVFSEAAGSAQVILMTSSPDRYANIGEAHFVAVEQRVAAS
jgi:DNA repair exonuclease SbcCD ATPase subunit